MASFTTWILRGLLFEDQDISLEEIKTIYRLLYKNKKNPLKLNQSLEKEGKIIILSNFNRREEEIFHLYKSRDRIKKLFYPTKIFWKLVNYISKIMIPYLVTSLYLSYRYMFTQS
jgi:hypothetical protein